MTYRSIWMFLFQSLSNLLWIHSVLEPTRMVMAEQRHGDAVLACTRSTASLSLVAEAPL
jgi:hypothetical protein